MMAVIFFCLHLPAVAGPLPGKGSALADNQGHAHKHAAIWQLGSYIWVLPPENPQGLAQLYVRRPFVCKEKSTGFVGFLEVVENSEFPIGPSPLAPHPTSN